MEKKLNTAKASLVSVIIIAVVLAAGMVQAKDVLVESEIKSVTTQIDKNGNDYVRVIISEERELNGIKYTAGVPMMAFGDTVAQAQALSAGEQVKAICSAQEYQGRTSYTLVQVID